MYLLTHESTMYIKTMIYILKIFREKTLEAKKLILGYLLETKNRE